MATYAQPEDLRPRVGGRDITTTSDPNLDQVEEWIEAAEAMLLNCLTAASITVPTAPTANGFKIMREWVLDYAEGRYRSAMAAAGGDGDNEDGERALDEFKALMQDIRSDKSYYAVLLTGTAAGDATARVRGSSNITAEFTRDEQW